ncbi:MAG: redox-regulated ATPase YchF [Candidatus Eisenbacteria bacterium]|nr:redox-regulated ATPase YchF [Candidatus Eisenbacteria bacterium]
MKVGILGLPSSGKTTLFNLLTGSDADTTPFSAGRRGANLGVVRVPDERLAKIADLFGSKKAVPAEISFVDLAGLPGAADRSGERAEDLLPYLRDADALALVLRDFDSEQAPAPGGRVDPAADLDEIRADLILSDLAVVEKRLPHLEKEKKSGDPSKTREWNLLLKAKECLEGEGRLADLGLDPDEKRMLAGYGFLTLKGILVLRNAGEDRPADPPTALAEKAARLGVPVLSLNALLEWEIRELPEEEREALYESYGIEGHGRRRFIRSAYAALDLITFFTANQNEARAWPIPRGTIAVHAAGKVHTDLERGFIRAEVIPFGVLVELGGEKHAKEKGKMRLEGKEYVVQDGDVMLIRFSV